MITIERPRYAEISVEMAMNNGFEGYCHSQKFDGRWAVMHIGQSTIVGELMADGKFMAFDIVECMSADLQSFPLHQRLDVLDEFWLDHKNDFELVEHFTGDHREFLTQMIADGKEGIVLKSLNAPFGSPWVKVKNVQTWDVLVVGKEAPYNLVVELCAEDGKKHTCRCPARKEFDRINLLDIVEIAGFGLTEKSIREPRFVRVRHDKMVKV